MTEPLVRTLKEQCRVCYSCVRECPAKAIRISGGQAEVITERCIGCGNCVRVCTQQAKVVRSSVDQVKRRLESDRTIAAIIAPSFPAEFPGADYRKVVSMIRSLGFDHVVEVAFGADLVSREYRRLVRENQDKQYIATTCPAVVAYVERFFPNLVKNLAPVVSPMVATARAVRKLYGPDIDIVFIGPCLAKKEESFREGIAGDITEVLTFQELSALVKGIDPLEMEPSDFDPPRSGKGGLYPLGRGMLQAAEIPENLLSMEIVAADGTKEFVQAVRDFALKEHSVGLLELLCCNGCIMGSGMTSRDSRFTRRSLVSNYARKRYRELDKPSERDKWLRDLADFDDLDLSVQFHEDDMRLPVPTKEQLQRILRRKGKFNPKDELNCGACGYDTCIEHAIAIYMGLAESEMCLPYTIETLRKTTDELSSSLEELVDTRHALIQSEKLASLGRMASGIAHEINNPLTGVLTYGSLLKEDLKDSEFCEDLDTIVDETMRCRTIVRGLLEFARETRVERISADINNIITETMDILKRHVAFQNIRISILIDEDIPSLMLDVNQMRSVINNLAENAAHAMPHGGDLIIETRMVDNLVLVKVSDTGVGIPGDDISRIFDPFFTTKEAGTGTGLGLAVIYGIMEQHGGSIAVDSKEGKGTSFTLSLPINSKE